MTILGSTTTRALSRYWLCIGLLSLSLLSELALLAQVPPGLQFPALSRVFIVGAVIVGVLLLSHFTRYAGSLVLAAFGLYVIYVWLYIPRETLFVSFPLRTTIAAAAGFELAAAYFLSLSGAFAKEFRERRALAPKAIARMRLSILILLVAWCLALVARDIFRLAHA